MSIELDNIVEIASLQRLFDAFYSATGIVASIFSLDGKSLVNSGWQKICVDFHRQHPESGKMCAQSYIKINENLLQGFGETVYKCPHGLNNAAIPILVNNDHVANLFAGQFLLKTPDATALNQCKKQATRWGFNQKAYIGALKVIPVVSEKQIKAILQFLKQLSEVIIEIGLRHSVLTERIKSLDDDQTRPGSERKGREHEAQKLSQILKGNPIPTFVIDAKNKITHWNRACELLTDIPASDVIGTNKHRDAFYTEYREVLADLIIKNVREKDLLERYSEKFGISKLISEGYQGEDFFPKLGNNGKWLFFTGASLKDTDGEVIGAIETLQDVTERHKAEQELRDSEARYRQLFESANDAIFLICDGVIVDCNQKALDLFHTDRNTIIGLSSLDFSPEIQPDGTSSKDEILKRRKRIKDDLPQLFEWRFIRNDGSSFDAEVSLNRFTLSGSPHWLAIIRDVSERKAMIQTLQYQKTELDQKTRYLEKVNQALKASLDHREIEKRAVEEHLLVNLKKFIIPYIEELERCKISNDGKAYVDILRTNINEIVSKFSKSIFAKYMDFTPTEVRVADLIRDKKDTKEIANLLGLSPNSIKWHRNNIRDKLGLTNKKVNLYTYLNSLEK